MLITLVEGLHKSLDELYYNPSIRKKLIHVLVELAQNQIKHSESKQLGLTSDQNVISITDEDVSFSIKAGNPVTDKQSKWLTECINEINEFSVDELNSRYKEIAFNTSFNDKYGAGLGFLDMARRSKKSLAYQFYPLLPSGSYFLISVSIDKE